MNMRHRVDSRETEIQRLRKSVVRLQAENRRLRTENRLLHRQVAQAESRVVEPEAALDVAERQAKRQAAPFSKGPPRDHPRKPGRKPGKSYGRKAHREIPWPNQVDETYAVPLPNKCPYCSGAVKEESVVYQYQVEIPLRPIYRQFEIHLGRCDNCGRPVRGRHPLQTSDAVGAAGSQLGPDAQSAVVYLNKRAGLSHGTIVDILWQLFGIHLTRGGSAQIVLRAAERSLPIYHQIAASVSQSPWVVPDETGWKVGGHSSWLHVLVGDQATWYQIDKSRGSDVAAKVLGKDYSGTLIHDGWSPYDQFTEAHHQQCVGHLLRRTARMLSRAVGGAVHFPRQIIALFHEALAIRDRFHDGRITADELAHAYLGLGIVLEELVSRQRQNKANRLLAKHLARHINEWFYFLLTGLDATNYRAEQALRPAVVNRKVWGGNRNDSGKAAQQVLTSVLETCTRQQKPAVAFLHGVLCGTPQSLIVNAKARPP